ncbi:hypothetical protein Q8W71_01915 [Methylobacterium sp. NEAU 140]|uniref:hypothetical protein n=1 Tax=Methylobacterium sp. NEAU 140 TaxID=3064945 RepID=UPI002732977F|nr:hypothetical protein [Methylobacterium sp. NEAU 140]MDP4021366.1 hypothetical protein [Methylobacterium sp. NEAU 140]
MSARSLDLDRFRKCAALMRGGATAGERAAGEAAARRMAAAAGLTLGEALGLGDGAPPRAASRPSPRRPAPHAPPPMRAGPVTVEELIAEKARQQDWLKRKAAREARRLRAAYAQQEAVSAALRAEQARKDRAWAEARGREPAGT